MFANLPGALQLLPSKEYGPGWLKLGCGVGNAFKETACLPLTDPYEEIYKTKGKWWSLVREELINPADVDGHDGWNTYRDNILEAQSFHQKLSGKYHPSTFAFYGNGTDAGNGLTWGTVRWEMRQALEQSQIDRGAVGVRRQPMALPSATLLGMPLTNDSGGGTVTTQLPQGGWAQFNLSGKDSKGDGTVPEHSGAAPAKSGAKVVYHLNLDAAGHEGAYRVPQAQQVTLHAILNIVKDISVITL